MPRGATHNKGGADSPSIPRNVATTNQPPSFAEVADTQIIEVTPHNPRPVPVGGTHQFEAILPVSFGSHPAKITEWALWESSDPSVAIVEKTGSQAGLVTAISVGRATIKATYKQLHGEATLHVAPPTVRSLALTPQSPSIDAGRTTQFTATATLSDGTTPDVTAKATWESSDRTIVTINSVGLATAVSVGSATVRANYQGVSQEVTVNVSPATVTAIGITPVNAFVGTGQTKQLSAVATFSDGSKKDVTAKATWSSSDSRIARVSQTGLVAGNSCGQASITVGYDDTSGNHVSTSTSLSVVITFSDLGDADGKAFLNAKSRVNQLLTAFEKRGNLADAEIVQLEDALELVTEYVNNNPGTPIPNFNAAGLGSGNKGDLERLGIKFNTDPAKGPLGTGTGNANVIDDRFRAICDYLYQQQPPIAGLEHDPGAFPNGNGPNPGGLTDEQVRAAAVYGYVQNALAVPPQYKTRYAIDISNRLGVGSYVTPDDDNRRAIFNRTVEAADSHFRTNRALYSAALDRLLQTSQFQINVSDWAKVVELLVQDRISANNPQINTWIDRELATAQNVGQARQPSQINIDLPDLEQDVSDFEIISGNIFALQPAYFCAMLEELKVFQVVEKLVELFQNGILPVVRGDAGNLLFAYWKNAALRVSEAERRSFYARTLGIPGGDADSPNREFKDLFMRFVSAVSSFVRQNTIDNLLRSNIPGAISQQQVRKAARDLATNISSHGYGIAYPMATELQKEINDVMAILKNGEIQDAYGAKDVWQLVDQVAGLELGGAKNSVKYRTMASAGATVFAWLANKAKQLSTGSYSPILDVAQLQSAPTYSTKATTNPSDFELVGASDQWLAVTGTDEDSVEKLAQPIEAPAMPSRPIQIPAVARDMLESVGVPAMGLAAASNGKAKWRYS